MKSITGIATVALALGFSASTALADEYDTTTTTVNTPTIASGLVLFGVSYGAGVIAAGVSDNSADQRLYVPIVGPWLDLADRDDNCPIDQTTCDRSTTSKILVGADGVFQALGVATAIYGILTPRTVVSHDDDDVTVIPVAMQDGGHGLAVKGHF